jgi:hypothetical protein
MDKLIKATFVICIFLALQSINLGFLDFYYYYLLILITFPYLIYRYKTMDKWLLIVLLYLSAISVLNILLGNNDFFSFSKSLVGITVAYWFYSLVIKHANYRIDTLMGIYYYFAYWVAVIGLVQFVSFLIGFRYGYDLSWLGLRVMTASDLGTGRFYPVHSIAGEPAAFGFMMAPAVYIAVARLSGSESVFGTKKAAIIILIALILTQSSASYFALLASIVLVSLNKINFKRIFISAFGLILSLFILYSISPKFHDRLDSSIQLMTGSVVLDAANTVNSNGSSLILFNHFIIAVKNASDHPFGTGLGSHHVAFEKYNSLRLWITGYGKNSVALNLHDASSLLNRILSEMGFVGLFFAAWFIVSNFLKSDTENKLIVIVNHASLLSILSALLRSGHYFVLGLPFFILCYYYSKILSTKTENIDYIKLQENSEIVTVK